MTDHIHNYRLIEDNDGHWYIIPREKETEFWAWVNWCEMGLDEQLEPKPVWVEMVDGPHSVIFHSYVKL